MYRNEAAERSFLPQPVAAELEAADHPEFLRKSRLWDRAREQARLSIPDYLKLQRSDSLAEDLHARVRAAREKIANAEKQIADAEEGIALAAETHDILASNISGAAAEVKETVAAAIAEDKILKAARDKQRALECRDEELIYAYIKHMFATAADLDWSALADATYVVKDASWNGDVEYRLENEVDIKARESDPPGLKTHPWFDGSTTEGCGNYDGCCLTQRTTFKVPERVDIPYIFEWRDPEHIFSCPGCHAPYDAKKPGEWLASHMRCD